MVQMVTVYSPLTWGIYTKPPPDIPECGFVGELCPPPIQGQSPYSVMTCEIYANLLSYPCLDAGLIMLFLRK